jgi:biopolymer transport protein ExbB
LSVAAIAVALERWIHLRRAGTDTRGLLKALRPHLTQGDSLRRALEACQGFEGAVARLAAVGVQRFSGSPAQIEKSLERQAQREIRRLRRGLGLLAATAGTAPLLGFLGTVTGMMSSFDALVQVSLSDPSMVAEGIKEALTSTAAGLTIAVPVQLIFGALSSRVDRIIGEMEDVANFLLEIRESRWGAESGRH